MKPDDKVLDRIEHAEARGSLSPGPSLPSRAPGQQRVAARGRRPPRTPANLACRVGTVVGSYQILQLLGAGSTAQVFLGERSDDGSKVAIKMLHTSRTTSAELVARFFAETRAADLLGHENIAKIHELGHANGRPFIVMEYLEGSTLAAHVAGAALSPAASLSILMQVCSALQSAHARGVVHRGLTPASIFLVHQRRRTDFVKLIDFGIVGLRGLPPPPTATSPTAGWRAGQLAPDPIEGGPADGRTDIRSVGVIAWWLSTARSSSVTPSPEPVAGQQQRPLWVWNPALPAAWVEAILVATEQRPGTRFRCAAEFGEALTRALRAEPTKPAAAGLQPPPSRPWMRSPRLPALCPGGPQRYEVELTVPGCGRSSAICTELSRGGAFIPLLGPLPAMGSRVSLDFVRPAPERHLLLAAEVVRHVSRTEGRAWRMAPGFAVQFVGIGLPARLAIEIIAASPSRGADPPPAHAPSDLTAAERLLSRLAPVPTSRYRRLAAIGDPGGAGTSAPLLKAVATLREILARPLPDEHLTALGLLVARLEGAIAGVGSARQSGRSCPTTR